MVVGLERINSWFGLIIKTRLAASDCSGNESGLLNPSIGHLDHGVSHVPRPTSFTNSNCHTVTRSSQKLFLSTIKSRTVTPVVHSTSAGSFLKPIETRHSTCFVACTTSPMNVSVDAEPIRLLDTGPTALVFHIESPRTCRFGHFFFKCCIRNDTYDLIDDSALFFFVFPF